MKQSEKKRGKIRSQECYLEKFWLISSYVKNLMKIKLVRTDYFHAEMFELIDAIEKDIACKSYGVVYLEGLREELVFLNSFVAKSVSETVLSSTYLCKRPKNLTRNIGALAVEIANNYGGVSS